jgi:RNA polymerase sigma-70 factor (ECF subfamily)
MSLPQNPLHIAQIDTLWPEILAAHSTDPASVREAQLAILTRYRPAAFRYLLACVRRSDVADELCQEFALRFVRGDFRNANPEKGRFRDLLKSALYHLVVDYQKRCQRSPAQLDTEKIDPVASQETIADSDRQFLSSWRASLLAKAWQALLNHEQRTGQPVHTVLHCRAANPEARSQQLADILTEQLKEPKTAVWVRKWVSEGRERFAKLLLRHVMDSLRDQTIDAVEEELIDLELYQHCKPAVDEWRKGGEGS